MYRFNLIVFFAVSFLFSQIEHNHSEFNWYTFDTKHSGADWDVNDIYEIVGIIKELNGA